MDEQIVEIKKASKTEIEIIETIPEKTIPAQIIRRVVSIDELNNQKTEMLALRDKAIFDRATPVKELEKIDNDIARYDAEIVKIDKYIESAKDKGVISEAEVISEATVAEEIINP